MSILDIFSFKKDLEKIVTVENFNLIKNSIKEDIILYAKDQVLRGHAKMNKVVERVIKVIEEKIKSNNKIVQWIIDNILIKNIRLVAQSIYDDLKATVEGL